MSLLSSLVLLMNVALAQSNDDALVSRSKGKENVMEFDEPGSENVLNRQLWEYAKGTSYKSVEAYVAKKQAESRASMSDEVELPTGWRISPAGRQIPVGHFPYEAIIYEGKLVVLNTGYYESNAGNPAEDSLTPRGISIIDPAKGKIEKSFALNDVFPSAVIGKDGDLYVSGGFDSTVDRFGPDFSLKRVFKLRGYTAGITPVDAHHLAVLYLVTTDTSVTPRDPFGNGHYVKGGIALLNLTTGRIDRDAVVGYFPYAVQYADGKLFVSVLGEGKVNVYDTRFRELKSIEVGTAPADILLDGGDLYVVNTTSDEISVINAKSERVVRRIFVGKKGYNSGVSPTSCAVSGGNLYVSEATLNAVAVYNLADGRLLGYIPTGWYTTKVLADKSNLYFLSAKGILPRRPNPNGPSPVVEGHREDYVLNLLRGTAGIVPLSSVEKNLKEWTTQVENGSPVYSGSEGLKLPIKHVFYIIKENRSYDQVLGDLGRGNGDSSLTIFGRGVTPNIHKLATDFVDLDNFYADGEISVLGHSFTTSGYASPFLEWLGNAAYSGRYRGYPFGTVPAVFSKTYIWDALDAKGVDYKIFGEPYYLMTAAYKVIDKFYGANSELARKFYANSMALAGEVDRGAEFSEFVQSYYGKANTPQDAFTLLGNSVFTNGLSRIFTGGPALGDALKENVKFRRAFATFLYHYSFSYWTWDLWYSDLHRFTDWKEDFDHQLKSGNVVPFEYIWLPNDHTGGLNRNYQNPYQLVAENDISLGLIVETIANSPIWKNSLILVEEDDAQNGPDHVDATRTEALAIGPYVKRGAVVHDRYDQLSMLRTVELILGLNPLNFDDAMAVPMFGVFSSRPDFSKYVAAPASDSLSASDKFILEGITKSAEEK